MLNRLWGWAQQTSQVAWPRAFLAPGRFHLFFQITMTCLKAEFFLLFQLYSLPDYSVITKNTFNSQMGSIHLIPSFFFSHSWRFAG